MLQLLSYQEPWRTWRRRRSHHVQCCHGRSVTGVAAIRLDIKVRERLPRWAQQPPRRVASRHSFEPVAASRRLERTTQEGCATILRRNPAPARQGATYVA